MNGEQSTSPEGTTLVDHFTFEPGGECGCFVPGTIFLTLSCTKKLFFGSLNVLECFSAVVVCINAEVHNGIYIFSRWFCHRSE